MRDLSTIIDRQGPEKNQETYYKIFTEFALDPVKVPKEAEDLKKVASYRTKNRFPVLSSG